LLQWLRDYYANTREGLSEKTMEIIGLPVIAPDPLYMPVAIWRRDQPGEEHRSLQLVPKSLEHRVKHTKDMDEEKGALDIFVERSHSNAIFINFATLNLEMKALFTSEDVQKSIRGVYSEKYWTGFKNHLADVMSQKAMLGTQSLVARGLMNYGILKLWLNLGSAARQISSLPAIGYNHGLVNSVKFISQAAATKVGRDAAREVFNSPQAQARFARGQAQLFGGAFATGGVPAMRRAATKVGLLPNRWMDLLTIALAGSGIYRAYLQEENALGASPEDAKAGAMGKMWAELERSQQSAQVINQAEWQRRGGLASKLFGMFRATPQQYLGVEIAAFRGAIAKGKPFDAKLWRTLFINHFIIPTMFKAVDVMFRAALGEAPDEEDFMNWIQFMMVGPFSGWFLGGTFISAGVEAAMTGRYNPFGNSLVPAAGLTKDLASTVFLMKGMLTAEPDEILKELDRLFKSNAPLYRDLKKAIVNWILE